MKKIITILGIVGIIIIAVFVFQKNQQSSPVISESPTPKPISLCYRYENTLPSGFSDRALLIMNFTGTGGTNLTGEYRNYPAESDSKVGTFTGTAGPMIPAISARIADVWWDSFAEGMRVTEQLRIVFGEGSAAAQFGEMVDRGDGVYVYKDVTNLTSGFQMNQVDCTGFDIAGGR